MGAYFDHNRVSEITIGYTNKDQIKKWFGLPYMTGVDKGDKSWTYLYTETKGSTAQTKNLYIVFDQEDLVKDFTFQTSFPKEKKY